MLLRLDRISVTRKSRKVLQNISFTVDSGEFVGLIGPNGAGKTTLLRAALGLLSFSGRSSLAALPASARAKAAALLPQTREINWPLSVERLVALGRANRGASLAFQSAAPASLPRSRQGGAARSEGAASADQLAVEAALEAVDLLALRARAATELSGGEQARALLARALAQDTPLLIADEPTAGLDPAAQLGVMELFARLAHDNRSVLASLHDLGLAARFCTRLIVVSQGEVVADGAPLEVLSPELLAEVFGISARIEAGPDGVSFTPLARLR